MKRRFFSAMCIGLLLALPLQAKKSGKSASGALYEVIQQAKSLLAQGSRKQAIEQLDHARPLAKSRGDERELAAKRMLFAEQFIGAEAFQKYQVAKGLAEIGRWDDCLREVDAISESDQDNILVLRVRAECQFLLKQYPNATKTFKTILTMMPGDIRSAFSLVQIELAQKRPEQGLALLSEVEPQASPDIEQFVILKAKLLELAEKPLDAVETLRGDQEEHLDHVEVLYELGMLYTRIGGHDWPARKMLSLFVTRCKRMKEPELKARRFEVDLQQAQAALAALDKKLGV